MCSGGHGASSASVVSVAIARLSEYLLRNINGYGLLVINIIALKGLQQILCRRKEYSNERTVQTPSGPELQ